MELHEYVLYSEGFIIRRDRKSADLRKLYTLMYDINVRKEDQIGNSLQKINAMWPLSIDKVEEVKALTESEMLQRWHLFQSMQNG